MKRVREVSRRATRNCVGLFAGEVSTQGVALLEKALALLPPRLRHGGFLWKVPFHSTGADAVSALFVGDTTCVCAQLLPVCARADVLRARERSFSK